MSPLENKKRSKNKKPLKNSFFIKLIKNVKNVFYIYGYRDMITGMNGCADGWGWWMDVWGGSVGEWIRCAIIDKLMRGIGSLVE